MSPIGEPVFGGLPDLARCGSLDDLVGQLRRLKIWAGNPSYEFIKDRVNADWRATGRPANDFVGKSTVADCFRTGRQRLNTDLVLAVVEVLHADAGYVAQWRQAFRLISDGMAAALQVRVQDDLPQDVPGFTGRADELDRIRSAARHGRRVVTISGMPGVGKTRLATHAGRLLTEEQTFDRVFFVDLRGFHPDPAQPPAAPAAVLEAFLRLLGVPAQQLPRDVAARVTAYHDRLTGIRALVVLDNAADTDQIRPLIADSPGCLTLVTSRRRLTGLPDETRLSVGVFSPQVAERILGRAVQNIPVGSDPKALSRIARRCGYLPLALGLVAGHIRGLPGWTLTDHADRLDKRHHEQRLDTAVELAFDLSYRHLPAAENQLLRLLALHPGHDFDAYAAAALTATGLNTARRRLRRLSHDNLLLTLSGDRYTFHDLIRAHATSRAGDDEPPSAQRAALTRLFDHYLATATTAMNALYPAETHRGQRIPPAGTPSPDLTDPDAALAWLDTERSTLVAVSGHAVDHGWPIHTTRLSVTLFRYLTGGHHGDALTIHGNAYAAAERAGDPIGQANALASVGAAYGELGQYREAAEHLQHSLRLFRWQGDRAGQVRALINLGNVETALGQYRPATEYYEESFLLGQQIGDRAGEARALVNLGHAEVKLGLYQSAIDHLHQVLELSARSGDQTNQARALLNLGAAETQLDRFESAADHLHQAVQLYRKMGNRTGEAWALNNLGTLNTRRGHPARAGFLHHEALEIFRDTHGQAGEAAALNGLGHAASTSGRPADAISDHTSAHRIAAGTGSRYEQAKAHAGLGGAHRVLGDSKLAGRHYRQALTLYRDLGVPEADQIQAELIATDDQACCTAPALSPQTS
jgi:tetratricopeptide (TPR) repeat protein